MENVLASVASIAPTPWCMEDLAKRKAEVDVALAATHQELKRARQQEKDAKKAAVRARSLSESLAHSVLIVYVLTDYASEAVATFLHNAGRRRHWPEKCEDDLVALVEKLFEDTDLEKTLALTNIEEPADAGAMESALPYVLQWRAVEWTRRCNMELGVAPSTESILQELEQQRAKLPLRVRPGRVGTASDPKARVWAATWRGRWGGRFGKLPLRDATPVPELQQKVPKIDNT